MADKKKSYMKDCEFLKDHGQVKKEKVISYHESTAKALEAHKIVKIVGDTKVVEKTEDKVKMKKHDVKK